MARSRSLVCVGLDPEPARMPLRDVSAFNRAIIDATADLVCAYKPNLGHYEALGIPGLSALEETIEHIRSAAPGVVLIADAKRGDVGSTSAAYARAMFEAWGFDATTVNAYGGGESLAPFLEYADRGVYVWCRSSNPGAAELQDLLLESGETVFERLAARAVGWDARAAVGLVAGATYPADIAALRALAPEASLLGAGCRCPGRGPRRSRQGGGGRRRQGYRHRLVAGRALRLGVQGRLCRSRPGRRRQAAQIGKRCPGRRGPGLVTAGPFAPTPPAPLSGNGDGGWLPT